MNIYLSGMIGAGKTTLGRLLAERLRWDFDDLDTAMASLAGKSFREVVAEDGWLRFRELEYTICKQFARMHRTVIGLGGGTVRYEWNRDVLHNTGINVLLVADLSVLASRVQDNDRPRVNVGTTLEDDLARIWEQHHDLYLAFADLVFDTGRGQGASEAADELLRMLAAQGGIVQFVP
jgi:shikimate kinase